MVDQHRRYIRLVMSSALLEHVISSRAFCAGEEKADRKHFQCASYISEFVYIYSGTAREHDRAF